MCNISIEKDIQPTKANEIAAVGDLLMPLGFIYKLDINYFPSSTAYMCQ